MLERTEFSLSRAAITIGMSMLLCLMAVLYWWWQMEHNTPPPKYFHQSEWQRIQKALEHVQPETASGAPAPASSRTGACTTSDAQWNSLNSVVERFNQQLAQARKDQFLKQSYRLDVQALLQSPEFEKLHCPDVTQTLRWLIQNPDANTPVLQSLNWKERLPASVQARLPSHIWVSVGAQSWTKRSPWAGLPGCMFWTQASDGRPIAAQGSSARDQLCQEQAGASSASSSGSSPSSSAKPNATAWGESMNALPTLPGQAQLLTRLAPWRIPQHDLYERLVGERNRVTLRGTEQPMGLNVQLTLDPRWQNLAQQLSECYSGLSSNMECRQRALDQDYFEKARVRMAAIAVVDVPTGRIVAAASASSPCHAFDQSRVGARPVDCPSLQEGTVHRPKVPQDIINHALFTQAPPGSLVKPLMMAGMLSKPFAPAALEGLEAALQRSDSQRFLDAFFCRQRLGSGTFHPSCTRPEQTLDVVHRLGWNLGCNGTEARSLVQCGKLDLLHGIPLSAAPQSLEDKYLNADLYQPIQWPTLTGLMMVKPMTRNDGSTWMSDMKMANEMPSPETLAVCARTGKKGYAKCKGQRLSVMSEAYGQGNARTTPVGVAGMLAALANSAQARPQRYPHLIEAISLGDGRVDPAMERPRLQGLPLGPEGVPASLGSKVIAAMEKTHAKGGTAYTACTKVMKESVCDERLGIAGKTGTPGDVDDRSLAQLKQDHLAQQACLAARKDHCEQLYPSARPRYRWYAAVFKSSETGEYDKAIAVLVHSNWRKKDGRFSDENSAAAEMAMQFIHDVRPATSPAPRPTSKPASK